MIALLFQTLVSYEDCEWRNHLREYLTALSISRLLTQSLLENCEVFIFVLCHHIHLVFHSIWLYAFTPLQKKKFCYENVVRYCYLLNSWSKSSRLPSFWLKSEVSKWIFLVQRPSSEASEKRDRFNVINGGVTLGFWGFCSILVKYRWLD